MNRRPHTALGLPLAPPGAGAWRLRRSGARATAFLLLASSIALASGCGADDARRRPIETLSIGAGETGAVVLKPPGPSVGRPVVVFFHGVFATNPRTYGPWLAHLVRQGDVVVYPRYQSALTPPNRFLANAVTGIRAALARVPTDRRRLVVAGHSAGGALAADYAAVAPSLGLPSARAVLAAYPGRRFLGTRAPALAIPAAEGRLVPPSTRILSLGGADDRAVGSAAARNVVRAATRVPRARRTFRLIRDPAVDDHLGPQRAEEASRRVFWTALDSLVAQTR